MKSTAGGAEVDAPTKALGLLFLDELINAFLVDRAQALGREAHGDPFARFGDEQALALQIGLETALGLAVRVGNAVAHDGTLSGKLTDLGHDEVKFNTTLKKEGRKKFFALVKNGRDSERIRTFNL
jgi:hypothetical protein